MEGESEAGILLRSGFIGGKRQPSGSPAAGSEIQGQQKTRALPNESEKVERAQVFFLYDLTCFG